MSGAELALGALSQWVGAHAPTAGLWHLFTDCFPRPGTVGLSSIGALCDSAHRLEFTDSGVLPAGGDTDECGSHGYVEATGNCIQSQSQGMPCEQGEVACHAKTGLSSNSVNLWHTFAHEVGHNLGGEHQFSNGGLMAYSDERALYD